MNGTNDAPSKLYSRLGHNLVENVYPEKVKKDPIRLST